MLFFMLLLLILLNVLAWLQHTKNAWADTGLDLLHQVSVSSGTGHPWHKARDNRNSAKPQWKIFLDRISYWPLSFHSAALVGGYSDVTLPYLTVPYTNISVQQTY